MNISKTTYVTYTECPRLAYYNLISPLSDTKDPSRAKEGHRVGIYARDYLGKNAWVLYDKNNPTTAPGIYAEYYYEYNDLICYTDLLVINNDGSIDIYEVKAVNDGDKDKFKEDVSFQYYVATKSGHHVRSVYLLTFDKDYIYQGGNIDITKLFKKHDMTNLAISNMQHVEDTLNELRRDLNRGIPQTKICSFCRENHVNCQYLDRCKAIWGLPQKESIFELYNSRKKNDYLDENIHTWKELKASHHFSELSNFNQTMINFTLENWTSNVIKKAELKEYLSKVKYPVFFFDFEGVDETIPVYPNSRPYSQIVFQYSLHISRDINDDEATIIANHKDYLGDGINDPREALIIQMLDELEEEGTIFAYHKSYEESRIKDLARDFPKYRNRLLALLPRFMDLEEVFLYHPLSQYKLNKKGELKPKGPAYTLVYHPLQGASTSIKTVLPAFFNGRTDLDYSKLDQVHHGTEAANSYKELKTLQGKEKLRLIDNMKKYCGLDTKAMVVLYLKYRDLAK